MNSYIYINPPYCFSRASFLRCQELIHSYHREIKRFNVMTLACASIFANGFCMTWGEKNLGSCWNIQRHVLKSVELEEENDQGFLLRFQSRLQKKVSVLAARCERCQWR